MTEEVAPLESLMKKLVQKLNAVDDDSRMTRLIIDSHFPLLY